MSPVLLSAITGALTLIVTLATTLALVSYRLGQGRQRIDDMEKAIARKAESSDLEQIKLSLAEIKGMFVLRLRE